MALAANVNTYVFALSNDHAGVQINHFTLAGTNIDPATYKTAGTGTNTLTASSTS